MYIYKDLADNIEISTWIDTNTHVTALPNLPSFESYLDYYQLRKAEKFEISLYEKEIWQPVGNFSISTLAGNHSVLVLHAKEIYHAFRNKGLGQKATLFAMELGRLNGYSLMVATVIDTNEIENHILTKLGWVKVNKTFNKKTRNFYNTYTYTIT